MAKISPLQSLWISVLMNSLVPIILHFAGGVLSPFVFVFASVLPIAFIALALKYTTPANAAILLLSEALYTMFLSRLFLREKINFAQICAALLVMAGTGIILFEERFTFRWKGDLIVLAAPLFYQVSHIMSKKLPKDVSHDLIACARTFFTALTSLPLAAASFFLFPLAPPEAGTFSLVLIWGFAVMFVNNLCWYRAILNMDLSKATGIVLAYPVFTVILSAAMGIEKIRNYQAAGLVLALAGASWMSKLIKTVNERPGAMKNF